MSLRRDYNFVRIIPDYLSLFKQIVVEDIATTLNSTDTWRQYLILQVIHDLLRGGDFPPDGIQSSVPLSFTFAWDTMQDLILDVMETSFQRIVNIAISSYDITGCGVAQDIIKCMSESGEHSEVLKFEM